MEVDNKHQGPNRWLQVIAFLTVYILCFLGLALVMPVSNQQSLVGSVYIPLTLSTVLSLIVGLVFQSFIFRQDPLPVGLAWRGEQRSALSGACLGLAIIGIGSLLLAAMHYLRWNDAEARGEDLVLTTLLLLAAAFGEEYIFRGIILRRLLESTNRFVALVASSLLFAFFHINNPDVSIIALVNIFLGGVLLGITYSYTKNLWFGWMLHFTWNLAQGPLLGFSVSGLRLPSLVSTELNGPLIVTGGSFGLEGSLLQGFLIVLGCIALWIMNTRKFQDVELLSDQKRSRNN